MKPLRTLFISLALLVSFAHATTYPITLRDELGRDVSIEQEPERIISMLPSHTESLCAMAACDKLIAIDTFSDFPEQILALPRMGGGLTGFDGGPNIEAIIALEPDLVLVSEFGELADILEQAGLTVFAESPQTYKQALEWFSSLGHMVNRESEAALLRGRVSGEIEAIADLTANMATPSVYYEIDPTPYTVGPNSFIGELMRKAGGENIIPEELGDFPQIDPEFVIAADPDIIIMSFTPESGVAASLSERAGWSNLSALQDGDAIGLSEAQGAFVNRPGPRMADTVRLFASFFHPDLFEAE